MRVFQLTPETRLVVSDLTAREEALLELTRQKGTVLKVVGRLSLSVQHSFDALDDVLAMGQEELEKFDVFVKRHRARTRHALDRTPRPAVSAGLTWP
jgi:hypothetical protein